MGFLITCSSKPPHQQPIKSDEKVIVPFELIDNRIFVDVMINDQGPFKFIFDTGGANCITPQLAKRLNLTFVAAEDATGAGENSIKSWKTQIQKFNLNSLLLQKQDFMIMDLSAIQNAFEMKALDGIFGYEFLLKYSAQINYEKKLITFSSSNFETEGFFKIPFSFLADKPVVEAKINGFQAALLVDTGDRSSLTVFSNFRKIKKIDQSFVGKPIQTTGYGIGGPIPGLVAKLESLEITPLIKFNEIIARTPTTKGGFNAISDVNASIGNEILRQFHIIFDYKNKFIFLKPNANFGEITKFTPVPNNLNH